MARKKLIDYLEKRIEELEKKNKELANKIKKWEGYYNFVRLGGRDSGPIDFW